MSKLKTGEISNILKGKFIFEVDVGTNQQLQDLVHLHGGVWNNVNTFKSENHKGYYYNLNKSTIMMVDGVMYPTERMSPFYMSKLHKYGYRMVDVKEFIKTLEEYPVKNNEEHSGRIKAGDKVYIPQVSKYPMLVRRATTEELNDKVYWRTQVLVAESDAFKVSLDINGCNVNSVNPIALLANKENYQALSQVFDIEPANFFDNYDLIKEMLDSGAPMVLCDCSLDHEEPLSVLYAINRYDDETRTLFSSNNRIFSNPKPFDVTTGKYIVDFVNGQIVTA